MYEYKAHVDKVIDGDTIDVTLDLGFKTFRKERLRLFGIDTPECRTTDLQEKQRGLAAKKFVTERIQDRDITLTTKKQGKFGRYLAVVWYGSAASLNDMLIDDGMAVEYYGGKR